MKKTRTNQIARVALIILLLAEVSGVVIAVNRPIVASPHGLEEFPSLLQGYPPQAAVKNPTQAGRLSTTNTPALRLKQQDIP